MLSKLTPFLAGSFALAGAILMGCQSAETAAASDKSDPNLAARQQRRALEATSPAPSARSMTLGAFLDAPLSLQYDRNHVSHRLTQAPHCAGHYTQEPTLRVSSASEAQTIRVEAIAKNDIDMTLAIRHPDGSWSCFDDGAGERNPGGTVDLSEGTHDVFVGSYAPRRALDFDLRAKTVQKIDWTTCEDATLLTVGLNQNETLSGTIVEDLEACSRVLGQPTCLWHLTQRPMACVDLTAKSLVTISTEQNDFDTVLAVQQVGVGGGLGDILMLNDDAAGRPESSVQGTLEPGRYAIFVGSYRFRSEGIYNVRIQTAPVPQR